MKNFPKFEVTQGIVTINSIGLLQYNNTSLCCYIDFKEKYPSIGSVCEALEFTFDADENTLNVKDKMALPTIVKIKGIPKSWEKSRLHISVSMGRYNATIFVIKQNRKKFPPETMWYDKE